MELVATLQIPLRSEGRNVDSLDEGSESMRVRGIWISWLAVCLAAAPALCRAGTHDELLAHHAPVIRQDTAHARADFITRFDFDGNRNGADNWDNMDRHPLTAHVYGAAVETSTHWYLTYAFFHPRDYDRIDNPFTSHENDLEGIMLMVEKDGSSTGRLILMETVAHMDFYQYSAASSVQPGSESLDGTIRFEGSHPIVEVEARGHGVHGWNGKGFPGGDGVVYRYGARAAVPRGPNDPDCKYDLLPIQDTLWAWRFEVGAGKTYGKSAAFSGSTYGYAFQGTKHGDCKANAPWGWDDKDDGDVVRGDFFLDPASMVTRHLRFSRPVSLEYTFNPYLTGEEPGGNARRNLRRQDLFAALHAN